jgi:hypothetical protein
MDITAVVVLNETPPVTAVVAVDETTLQATVNPSPGEAGDGGALTLPQPLGQDASPTFAGLTLGGMASSVGSLVLVRAGGQLTTVLLGSNLSIANGTLNAAVGGGDGGYSSLTMPTGFGVSGNGSASLVVTIAAGYSLPTTTKQTEWDSAYSERRHWDGGGTGLNATTARASLGLAEVAASGAYGDLSGRPTLGTAAATNAGAYATAAQGGKADSAVQPAGLTGYVQTSDARLSDAREWSAPTVDQPTAEAGISAIRVPYSPLRVFQSVAAWWTASAFKTKLDGIAADATVNASDAQLRDRFTHTGTQAVDTITGLGTLATQSGTFSGTSSGTNTGDQDLSGKANTGAIGSSGLTMTAGVLGRDTGTGAPLVLTLGSGLSIQSGNLVTSDVIKLVVSNKGETATPATNYVETTVQRACTVTGALWELAPSATGSSSSQAMPYARRSGTKTSLLSANASLASSAILTDASANLTGTLTLAAGDTVGVDLVSIGTGSSGHIFTITVRYS